MFKLRRGVTQRLSHLKIGLQCFHAYRCTTGNPQISIKVRETSGQGPHSIGKFTSTLATTSVDTRAVPRGTTLQLSSWNPRIHCFRGNGLVFFFHTSIPQRKQRCVGDTKCSSTVPISAFRLRFCSRLSNLIQTPKRYSAPFA